MTAASCNGQCSLLAKPTSLGEAYGQLVTDLRRVSKPEAAQRFTEIDQGERELGAIPAEYGKKTTISKRRAEERIVFRLSVSSGILPPCWIIGAIGFRAKPSSLW